MPDLDPRRKLFLKHYLDPESPTFSNATASAILAGYSENYADKLLSKHGDGWLADAVQDEEMIHKAERNLNDFLDESEDKKVKLDATKFVVSRLAKGKWSEKQEVEHSGEIVQHCDVPDEKLTELVRAYNEKLKEEDKN